MSHARLHVTPAPTSIDARTLRDALAEPSRMKPRSVTGAVLHERQRLARGLHDNLAQLLGAASLTIESLAGVCQQPVKVDRYTSRLRELIQLTSAEVRALVRDLSTIDRLPAAQPPDSLARRLRRIVLPILPASLLVDLDIRDVAIDESPIMEALAWVCEEAVVNVILHANATWLRVDLHVEHKTVVLVVADNGGGIATDAPARSGLTHMREHMREIGGAFRVSRCQNLGGTMVMARFPLLPAAAT